MKNHIITRSLLLLACSILNLQPAHIFAQGTAFTYQGRLNEGANPANGHFDLRFTIYDAASSGSMVGSSAITNAATPVTNGLFTVTLDFGAGVFDGNARWLEIGVQPTDGTNFATLTPRQAITVAPYAQFAGSAATAMIATSANAVMGINIQGQVPLGSLPPSLLTNGAAFVGDGAGVTNVNATTLNGQSAANFWQLGGNGSAPDQFIGTTNTQPMEIWSGNQRVMRLEQTFASAPNVIAGASVNYVAGGVVGAVIGGGGALNYYGIKHTNSVTADFGTVNGGSRNTVSGMMSSVGGGFNNTASGQMAVVAGGQNNLADGMYAIVAGGYGGRAGNNNATVGGGQNNLAAGMYSTVVGGYGGWAGSSYATVAGGYHNYALAQSSFAAGHMAQAQHEGSFVWADSSSSMSFSSVYNNEFAVRAAGGVRLVTSGAGVNVDGSVTATHFWGDGGGLSNVNAATFNGNGPTNFWLLGGNNVAPGQFLGSTNDQPLEFRVNNTCVLRLQYAYDDSWPSSHDAINFIAGTSDNIVGNTVHGATIAGGWGNSAYNHYASVLGGRNNTASGYGATAMGYGATASGLNSTAMGFSTTAGGTYSTAMGSYSQAINDGTFVWADSQINYFTSTTTNQFLIRAQNGVGINVTNPAYALDIGGRMRLRETGGSTAGLWLYQSGPANDRAFIGMDLDGHVGLWGELGADWGLVMNVTNGYIGIGNTTPSHLLQVGNAYCDGNTWSPSSDRNLKSGFKAVDAVEILAKVAALPITRWHYTNDPNAKHVGPMAQDFHAAFGLNGADDKHITDVDEGGVALAAIQGLNEKMESGKRKAETQMEQLAAENAELKVRLEKLEQLLSVKK